MSVRRRHIAGVVAVLAPALISTGFLPGAARASGPHVSVISDSVLTAVVWNSATEALLNDGLDLQIDAGVCRRLNGESCEFEGGHVPTTLSVISSWGNLGPIVVIVDGYNDLPANFAGDVELTLNTLRGRGVQQ